MVSNWFLIAFKSKIIAKLRCCKEELHVHGVGNFEFESVNRKLRRLFRGSIEQEWTLVLLILFLEHMRSAQYRQPQLTVDRDYLQWNPHAKRSRSHRKTLATHTHTYVLSSFNGEPIISNLDYCAWCLIS